VKAGLNAGGRASAEEEVYSARIAAFFLLHDVIGVNGRIL